MAASSPGVFAGLVFFIATVSVMSAYFSVTVKRTGSVLSKRIVSIDNNMTVSDLVEKSLSLSNIDIDNVVISNVFASETDTDGGSIVDLTMPLHVVMSFKFKFLTIHLDIEKQKLPSVSLYDKIMKAPEYNKLPQKYSVGEKKTRGDFLLFNDLIDMLAVNKVGFSVHNVNTVGTNVTKKLHAALWDITSHHAKLKDRGAPIPPLFQQFAGYYNHKLSHKPPPQLREDTLRKHVSDLSELLMLPWTSKFQAMFDTIEGLVKSMKKYADFLTRQAERTRERNSSTEVLRNPNMNFSLVHLESLVGPLKREYTNLDALVSELPMYEPIELAQHLPADRYDRRAWINGLTLSVPVAHYTYFQGNYLGNIHFIWRIPSQQVDRSEEMTVKAVQSVHKFLPKYATRQIKQEFIDKYQRVTKAPKALLRNMYRFLTDDCGSSNSEDQAAVDRRVEDLLLLDDPDIAWDLRSMNGNANSTKFDKFWTEMDSYFSEMNLAVQERRQNQHLYLPYAISIEDLVTTIHSRVSPETPIPSKEWVRLQFWPRNPNARTALRHTGKFDIKFSLQSRQIRGSHEDSHFVATQLVYLKEFAVTYREYVDFFWLDDKAIVPIGEPGLPVGTGVRPHNPSLVPRTGPTLSALDHDYNVCGAIPSVAFKSDLPSDSKDSFFNGVAFVTVKDKVFCPSNAIRHGCETVNILKSHYCGEEHMDSENPILVLYTDGGPDHRTTFGSVHVASLAMFMWLDLDMFVTARTAPMGSWANLAERVNSVLNLALQNVSLERETMSEELELRMKRVLSLKTARDTASRFEAFKDGLLNSCAPVLKLLEERFSHLKLKGESIVINSAADDLAVKAFFQILKDLVDENLDESKMTKKDLEKSPKLQDFFERHCQFRNYTFQMKKCSTDHAAECWYCTMNPPRLPSEVFDHLHFVPDPVVCATDKDKYEDFETLYGKSTTDAARPSLSASIDTSTNDKNNKKLLTCNKVRDSIVCVECGKPRCIYADKKLCYAEKQAILRVKELEHYTCGSSLFPCSNKYFSGIVVREGLRCSSVMETTYYASTTCSLKPVCFHCGIAQSADFADDSDIQSLQAQYSVVRPICRACKGNGKEAIVRGKKNVKKVRK